jgi:hypothetical protein
MLLRVTLVRTDVLEELSAPYIRVTRIGELGRMLDVTRKRSTVRTDVSEELSASFIRVTRIGELRTMEW